MSKINMNSSGVHKVISSVETKYKDDRVESYIQYIDACGQLLTKYKRDIEFIEEMYEKLRIEKVQFLKVDIPKVKGALVEAKIPQEQIFEWIEEIKKNCENSFRASEKILNKFSMDSIEQMKGKIEEILNG